MEAETICKHMFMFEPKYTEDDKREWVLITYTSDGQQVKKNNR